MQEFKGTPGKWAAFDHGVGDIVVFTDSDQSAVCVFDGDCVAWPSSNYQTDGTAMANAHLIAAAPDLLEALRISRDYVAADLEHRKQAFAGYPQKWETEERDLAAIDAAIAKALNTDTTER